MRVMMVRVIFIQLDFAWGFQKYIILGVLSKIWLSKKSCAWRMNLIFLTFMMMIMMVGVILNELDFAQSFQKCIILGVSGISQYLGDVLDLPNIPDGDHDGWSNPS